MSNGLLLTMTEPAPADEEEFNAWYDTEHLPERLGIPGFISARRWTAVDPKPGEGKYLATYELKNPQVLAMPAYLAHVGDNFTPWTKRCLGRAVVFRRWACEQILPEVAGPAPASKALFAAIGDVPAEHEAEFNKWYDEEHIPLLSKVPGVLAARRFRASSGTPRYVALYDLADERVPGREEWQAVLRTEWAGRIDKLTEESEWILKVYRAYRAPDHRFTNSSGESIR